MGVKQGAFGLLHAFVHRGALPALQQTGALEPVLLRAYRWASQRPPSMAALPCPVEVDDQVLWYDRHVPSFTVRGLAMGTYERPTVALVKRVVTPGMHVVDVGAHIGYYTVLAASLVGRSGSVSAFEPDPATRPFLERNIEANGVSDRVLVVGKAVGAAVEELPLYRHRADSGSSSLFKRVAGGVDAVAVEVTTLDQWAASAGWPPVDLVKVDVEGAEPRVLAGMNDLVRRNPGMALVLELNAEASGDTDEVGSSLFDGLRRLGFDHVCLIDGGGLLRIQGRRDEERLARRSRWVPVNLYCRARP